MVCANIKHPDFIALKEAVGEAGAYYLWDRYNGEIDFTTASNGQPSIFHKEAEVVYGKAGAIKASAEIRMPAFLKTFGNWLQSSLGLADVLDVNGEPLTQRYIQYKEKNKPYKASKDHNFSTAEAKANHLQKMFKGLGVDVQVKMDKSLDKYGEVRMEAGQPVIYIGAKAQQDTAGHEFGHIYTDLLGYNHPLVKEGIRQLINTPLYHKVKEAYPHLDVKGLEMEVLTTAIGMESSLIFDSVAGRTKWQSLLNKIMNAISDLLGLQTNIAKRLAEDMIGGDFNTKLVGKLESKTRFSLDLDAIRDMAARQDIELEKETDAETNIEDSWYTIAEDGRTRRFLRLTAKVRDWFSLKQGKFTMPSYEYTAKKRYEEQHLSKDDKILYKDAEYDYKEFVEQMRIEENTYARVYGKIAHLYLQGAVEPTQEILDEIESLAEGVVGESLPVDKTWFKYITENYKQIFKEAGITVLDERVEVSKRDKMIPELTIVSKILGIGTTIDGLIRHSDGVYSIKDWKTGNNFLSDYHTSRMLKHGDTQIEFIGDSKISKAKLEIMFRAMIFKAEYDPEATFRDLDVVYLRNGRDLVETHSVNVEAYLGIIEDYMLDPENNMQAAYQTLKEKGLFDASVYGGGTKVDDMVANMPTAEAITYLERYITQLNLKYKNGKDADSRLNVSAEIARRTKQVLAMRAGKERNLYLNDDRRIGSVSDMSFIKAQAVGNRYSTHDPAIQVFLESVKVRETNYKNRVGKIRRRNAELSKAILEEYMAKNTGRNILDKATIGGLNFIDQQELFGFMWEEKKGPGKNGLYRRIITVDQIGDGTNGTFTQAQYEYNKFQRDTMKEVYNGVMGKPAYEENFGRRQVTVTMADILKLPNELPEDFAPRTELGLEEVMVRDKISKEVASRLLDELGNTFLENLYEPAKIQYGLPVKYMGSDPIIASRSHTIDTDESFDKFIATLIRKDELDDMLHVGQALATILENKTTIEGNKAYENSTAFLHSMIMLNVLDMKKDVTFNRLKQRIEWRGKTYQLSPMRLLMLGRHWVGAQTMWLKPLSAIRNAALMVIVTTKDALKGSIAKQLGIDEADIDFGMGDLLAAQAEYSKTTVRLPGSPKTKLQALAEHFNFLPDAFEYSTEGITTRNPILNINNAYFLHKIGEEYGALVMFAAQLKHRKFTNIDGKTMSMWDAYDVDNKGNVTWNGGTRGIDAITNEPITGITPNEINHLERVSARISGGYRKSERTVMETTSLGLIFLQFKKYLPSILENLFQSHYIDNSLGKYKTNAEGKMYWVGRHNEGRFHIFRKWFIQLLLMRKNSEYSFKRLDAERQQHLLETWVTMSTMFASYMVYNAMEGDDDEDNVWYVNARRVLEDSSQGYDPRDLLRSLQQGTVVIPKMFKAITTLQDYLIDGVIGGKKTRKGDTVGVNGLHNLIPLSSSYYGDIKKIMDNEEESD